MMITVQDSLIYPYLPEYMMQMTVEVNKGMVVKDLDVTGISAVLGNRGVDSFMNVGQHTKNYYPSSGGSTPVSIRLQVSEKAYLYSTTTYMLTNWLIDIGGISKALYFGGLIISHFVALRAYKAALIGDVFMVQQEDKAEKESEKKRQEEEQAMMKRKLTSGMNIHMNRIKKN